MGKMEQALKFEIVRLAKKQVRQACQPLVREVRRLKRLVADVRRTVGPMKALGAELAAQRAAELAKLQAAPEEVETARLSAGLVKKLRARLAISQGEMAVLVGVSAAAVAAWEQGKARPAGRNKEAVVALRKLGRREVKKLLAEKQAVPKAAVGRRKRKRGKRAK
jgi:DNA-binding transcriptional regulator YiaG